MFQRLPIKKILLLKEIYSAAFFAFLITLCIFYYYIDRMAGIRAHLEHHGDELVENLERDLVDTQMNLYFLRGATDVFKYNLSIEAGLRLFRGSAEEILRRRACQYNAYFAFEPESSLKYFNKKAFILSTRKDPKYLGSEVYQEKETFVSEKWFDDVYQKSEKEIWYHIAKKSDQPEFSGIYFDSSYMKKWMITAGLGIYENNKFIGMVGIDLLLENLSKEIDETKIEDFGGAILFDKNTNTILLLPLNPSDINLLTSFYS